jgi:hypothetical protein
MTSTNSALIHFSDSLERGPALPGPVGWLVVQLLPVDFPAKRSLRLATPSKREHVGPAPRGSRPAAGAAGQPARTRHSVRLVADKAHCDQSAREKQQSALRSPHSNAAFYCGRLLNRREDAWVIPISPGARMIESQAPVSSNSSLERGPGPFGAGRLARCAAASGWLSSDAEASPRESLQPRTCWPGTSGNQPDRWRRRTASSYSALPSTRG